MKCFLLFERECCRLSDKSRNKKLGGACRFKGPFFPRLEKLPSIKPLPTNILLLVAALTTTITLTTILSTVTGHLSPLTEYDTNLKYINQGKNSFLDDC